MTEQDRDRPILGVRMFTRLCSHVYQTYEKLTRYHACQIPFFSDQVLEVFCGAAGVYSESEFTDWYILAMCWALFYAIRNEDQHFINSL